MPTNSQGWIQIIVMLLIVVGTPLAAFINGDMTLRAFIAAAITAMIGWLAKSPLVAGQVAPPAAPKSPDNPQG